MRSRRRSRSPIPLPARRSSTPLTAPLPLPAWADPQRNTRVLSPSVPPERLRPLPPLRAIRPAPWPAPPTPSNRKPRLPRSVLSAVPILLHKRSRCSPPLPVLQSTTRWTVLRPRPPLAAPHCSILRPSPLPLPPPSKPSPPRADSWPATSLLPLTPSPQEAPAPLTSAVASLAAA